MIVLATDGVGAKVKAERIVAWIASGSSIFEVSLSPHQALRLARSLQSAAAEAIVCGPPTAEVIALHKPKAVRRRAKYT